MLFGPLALAAACWGQGEEPPGEAVGTFDATGLMVEQSCGSAVPAADPLDLAFELRREDGGRAYWQRLGGPIFAGLYQDDEYLFTVTQSWMVIEPDRFRGYVGCSVTQRDTFQFALEEVEPTDVPNEDAIGADAGVPPTLFTLTGSQSTEIEPIAGSDCAPAVAAFNGPFLALPCRVAYVLTGSGVGVSIE